MKHRLMLALCLFLFSLTNQKAYAQWDLFGDLFLQMDSTVFDQFDGNLGGVDTLPPIDYSAGNGPLQDLYGALADSLPGGLLDSSYLFGIDAGIDSLLGNLPGFGLDGTDQDTLLGEIGRLDEIFGNNFDSLGGLFHQYQDSLVFDSTNWAVVVVNADSLHNANLGVLGDSLGTVVDTGSINSPGNLANLMSKIFDAQYFPDLELAFGLQQGDFKYWDDAYTEDAKVLRIGSVPRFDKTAYDQRDGVLRLPIEPRWHVQASWNGGATTPTADSNRGEAQAKEPGDRKGFNPLLLGGDFAMMATPDLGHWGNTSFKLITSLGIEFGTYAPAHKDYAPPFTQANKGFATGVGPQVGGGFAMTTGQLIVYSLATVAHGNVLRAPLPYRYDSRKLEVGMRYGNVINIRYSTGFASWQPDDNRRAKITNQLTIGIILKELHH